MLIHVDSCPDNKKEMVAEDMNLFLLLKTQENPGQLVAKVIIVSCPLDNSDNEKDERKFERRKAKSMAKARGRCLPMNFTMDDAATGILKERARIGSSLADVDPMNIDNKVCLAYLSSG